MPIRNFVSAFEELVMRAIICLGDNAYGVPIREAIEQATGRRISTGALYITLQRLLEKGFISARMGEATAQRGGRAKKYFAVESAGREALATSNEIRSVFAAEIDLGFAS